MHLETELKNFNVFLCEIVFARESPISINARVIHIGMLETCGAACVRVATVTNRNVKTAPESRTR
jgi:hypothetical protein